MSRKIFVSEEGQSVVIIALALVGLLAMLGLVIDAGLDYSARRQAQNAADAAATAGARIVIDPNATYATIYNHTASYADANTNPYISSYGGSSTQLDAYIVSSDDSALTSRTPCDQLTEDDRGTLFDASTPGKPNNGKGVRAYVAISYQPFLMSVLSGGGPITTAACATAVYGQVRGTSNLQPIAAPRCYADPTDPHNDLCKKKASDPDPWTVEHDILGGNSNKLYQASQIRAILNFNDRVLTNPPNTWNASNEDPTATAIGGDCGYGQGTKTDAKAYIDQGGYNGECGPVILNEWVDLKYGISSGVAGPQSYTKARYAVGQTIKVVLYQQCDSSDQPVFCGPRESDGQMNNGNACGGSECRIYVAGFALMKITYMGPNNLSAIWCPTCTLPEEVCPTCACTPGKDCAISLVP